MELRETGETNEGWSMRAKVTRQGRWVESRRWEQTWIEQNNVTENIQNSKPGGSVRSEIPLPLFYPLHFCSAHLSHHDVHSEGRFTSFRYQVLKPGWRYFVFSSVRWSQKQKVFVPVPGALCVPTNRAWKWAPRPTLKKKKKINNCRKHLFVVLGNSWTLANVTKSWTNGTCVGD